MTFSLNESSEKAQQRLKSMQQECATMFKDDFSDLQEFQKATMATQAKAVSAMTMEANKGKKTNQDPMGWMEHFQQTCASVQVATTEFSETTAKLAKAWAARRVDAFQSAQHEVKKVAEEFAEKVKEAQKAAVASVAPSQSAGKK